MYNLPCRETKRCFSSNLIIFSITNRNSSEVIGTSLKSHEVYSVTRTKTTMEIVYYGIQLKSFTLQWSELNTIICILNNQVQVLERMELTNKYVPLV